MLCNFIFYLYETCNRGVLVICCCPRSSESQTRNSYATSHITDSSTIIACTADTCHLTVQSLALNIVCTLNTCHSTIQTLALNIACTSNICHFTVQTLAPTLLILRMPVISLYQQWHHHSLYRGYVSLRSTNTGTIIACT